MNLHVRPIGISSRTRYGLPVRQTFPKLTLNPRGVLLKALTNAYVSRRLSRLLLKTDRIDRELRLIWRTFIGEKMGRSCALLPLTISMEDISIGLTLALIGLVLLSQTVLYTLTVPIGEIRNIRHMGY